MRASVSILAVACCVLAAANCRGAEHEFIPTDEFNALRAGNDEPVVDAGKECTSGETACDGECVSLDEDRLHCGECGNACAEGVCEGGNCLPCTGGEAVCDGICTRVKSDPDHCGACDVVCQASQRCQSGLCVDECLDGSSDCNGQCVDLRLDGHNCGECGTVCDEGLFCSGSRCRARCFQPFMECNAVCVDLSLDPQNCGECGNACGALDGGGVTECIEGQCQLASENCTNGEDDNGDGFTDCEDAACTESYRCLPPSPVGWSEPFVLLTRDGTDDLSCPSPFTNVIVSGLHRDLVAEAPECRCECTTTASCSVEVWFYDDAACSNDPWELGGEDALQSGTCESVYFERDGTSGAIAMWPALVAQALTEENTECTLTSSELTPPVWEKKAIGCAMPNASTHGCTTGTCVSREAADRYCVQQRGNQACPEQFPEKQLMHTDFIDDRACGECECQLDCETSFLAFTDEECSVDEQTLSAVSGCISVNPDTTPELEDELVWETRSFLVTTPQCAPEVRAQGAATPSGSVTVCCEAE